MPSHTAFDHLHVINEHRLQLTCTRDKHSQMTAGLKAVGATSAGIEIGMFNRVLYWDLAVQAD